MMEIHGWVTLREAFNEQNESEAKLAIAISSLEQAIDQLCDFNLFTKIM